VNKIQNQDSGNTQVSHSEVGAQLAMPRDPAIFRNALPRGSHARNFCLAAVMTYIKSEGLSGLDPAFFCNVHDIHVTLSRKLIPSIVEDVVSAGIITKGTALPFDVYAGYVATPGFLRAVRQDPSIIHPLSSEELAKINNFSDALFDTTAGAIEARWLTRIAQAFEHASPCQPLTMGHLIRLLPDFDGKTDRANRVLSAFDERELVAITKSETHSEVVFTPMLLELIPDRDLAQRLIDPTRTKIEFPWNRIDTSAIASSPRVETPPALRAPKITPIIIPEGARPTTPYATDGGEHAASTKVREDIMAAFPKDGALTLAQLISRLPDIGLSQEALRYHIKKLIDSGHLVRHGHGRGASMRRAQT
jgi:hypothetical protein